MAPTLDNVRIEHPTAGSAVVVFSGEHDLATEDGVRELLDTWVRWASLVVADFSSAQFVDSAILGVLVDTNHRARELGKTFRVQLGTAAIARRAFEIGGLFAVVEHVETRAEALAPRDGPST